MWPIDGDFTSFRHRCDIGYEAIELHQSVGAAAFVFFDFRILKRMLVLRGGNPGASWAVRSLIWRTQRRIVSL